MIAVCRSLSFQLNHLDADPCGRYLILDSLFDDVPLVIVNIFAPNSHQKWFFKLITKKLSQYPKEFIIFCRDFNNKIDNTLDSSNQRRQGHNVLFSLTHLEDLYDPWRCLHGSARDYKFYSAAQRSYSSIDLFLLHKNTLQSNVQADIGLITWSDHAWITISLSSKQPSKCSKIWHMNTSTLSQFKYQEEIKQKLENFFCSECKLCIENCTFMEYA